MSSKRTPALVMTLVLDRGHATPIEWRTRPVNACLHVHGKPSDAALAAHVKVWEESTLPEGANAHIGATKVLSAKIVRQATASRLYSNIREDMLVGFVVIDRMATPGKSLRQLADVATMHLLLDVNQDAGERDPGSILSLFEARGEGVAAPKRLSRFDRGALKGFYTQRENNRTARQQAENIAKAIEKGAGEEPEKR